jgi:hypothetical protein
MDLYLNLSIPSTPRDGGFPVRLNLNIPFEKNFCKINDSFAIWQEKVKIAKSIL